MAVNKYDRAAEAAFINTYAPIDFGALYQIGAANNAAVEKAQKEFQDQVKTWAEFQTPSVKDAANWDKLTTERAKELVQKFAENPELIKTAAGRSKIQQLINSTDYNSLRMLKESAEMQKLGMKIRAEMKAKNRYKESWDKSDIVNYDTLGTQKIFSDITPDYYQSLFEIVKPLVDDIKPSFHVGSTNPNNPKERLPFTKGWNAITLNDLQRTLQINKNSILHTTSGKNWYNDIANEVLRRNPNATEEEIDDVFMEAMLREASYKLYSAPVEDAYAQQTALLRQKAYYDSIKNGNKPTGGKQLGIEDVFATQYSNKLKEISLSLKQNDPSFKDKYDSEMDNVSIELTEFTKQLINNNKSFASKYQDALDAYSKQGVDISNENVIAQAFNYAFNNAKLTDEEYKYYKDLVIKSNVIKSAEVDEAVGRTIQTVFNRVILPNLDDQNKSNVAQIDDPTTNPFKYINVYTDGNDLMYDQAVVHKMWTDGLYAMSQEFNPHVGSVISENLFKNNDKINEEVGYSITPKKLMSPKQFIYNNNKYIKKLADEAEFDVLGTHLDRNTLGKDNFDIEELAAKGEFGKLAIDEIKGYVDTPNGRNFTVSVNIPTKSIEKYYNRKWHWFENPVSTLENYGFVVTQGSGLDEDGIWKDGYVTVDMVLPVSNHDLDKILTNRSWEEMLGTSSTKENQKVLDDKILTQMKGYEVGFGLK